MGTGSLRILCHTPMLLSRAIGVATRPGRLHHPRTSTRFWTSRKLAIPQSRHTMPWTFLNWIMKKDLGSWNVTSIAGDASQMAQIGPCSRGTEPGSSIGTQRSGGTLSRMASSRDPTVSHFAGTTLMPDPSGPINVRRPSFHHIATATSFHFMPITVRFGNVSEMPSSE